ncbi:hypothetical protein ACOME3_008972 [Neoechinorhynchus agilis]
MEYNCNPQHGRPPAAVPAEMSAQHQQYTSMHHHHHHSVCNSTNQIQHQQSSEFVFGATTARHVGSYQIPQVNLNSMPHNPFFAADYYSTNVNSGILFGQTTPSIGVPGGGGINAGQNPGAQLPLIQSSGNTINQGAYTLSHINRCNMAPPPPGAFGNAPVHSTNALSPNHHHSLMYPNSVNSFAPHVMAAAAVDYADTLRYSADIGTSMAGTSNPQQSHLVYHPPSSNNVAAAAAAVATLHPFYRSDVKIRDTFLTLTKLRQRNAQVSSAATEKPDTEYCKVCGAKSSGFHFGVFTCEACKGFFRRYSRKQRVITPCTVRCEITMSNRNNCPACRFAKCKSAGMAIENIRYGKPPKCVRLPRSISSVIPKLEDTTILNKLLEIYNNARPINTTSKTIAFIRYTAAILNVPQVIDAKIASHSELYNILYAVLNEELPEPHKITDVFEKILMCLFAQYKESICTNENCIGDTILQIGEQLFSADRKRKAKFMLTFIYVTSLYI